MSDEPLAALRLDTYRVQFFDQSGAELEGTAIAPTPLPTELALGSIGQAERVSALAVRLKLITPALQAYGAQVLQKRPASAVTTFNGQIWLSGERLNRPGPVEVHVSVPIRLEVTRPTPAPEVEIPLNVPVRFVLGEEAP